LQDEYLHCKHSLVSGIILYLVLAKLPKEISSRNVRNTVILHPSLKNKFDRPSWD